MKKNLLSALSSIFTYKPNQSYSFVLPETQEEQEKNNNDDNHTGSVPTENLIKEGSQNIYGNLHDNLEYLKVRYNSLINSDIVMREFSLTANGKEFKAFLLYIDGMINSSMINDFILKPLMLKSRSNTEHAVSTQSETKKEKAEPRGHSSFARDVPHWLAFHPKVQFPIPLKRREHVYKCVIK